MINLTAIRNNINAEITASKEDLDGFTFRCSMWLAEALLEALDLSIMELGVDEDGACYVGNENTERNAFRKRINQLCEEYCKDLNDIDNAMSANNQYGTCNPIFLKEQRIRTMGKMEALLKVLGG